MLKLPRLRRNLPRTRSLRANPTRHWLRPVVEVFEDRLLLSNFTVNSLGDTGTGSGTSGDLRYCITQADKTANNTINFSATGTIQLASALPALSRNVTITGPGASSLTVQGGGTSSNFSVLKINSGVTAAISDLTIAGGHTTTSGGGIDNLGTMTLTDCTISNDSALSGGGIFSTGTMTLTDCTISNVSGKYGGGINNYIGGTATLTGCTVSDSTAINQGGGISTYGPLNLINCTITGDTADSAGGIFNDGETGTMTLTNCTVTANRETKDGGGGIHTFGPTILVNTIVAGNFGGAAPSTTPNDIAGSITTSSSFNNLIGTGGSGGLTNVANGNHVDVADPGLGTLGNNGGPTQTIPLLPGSPAIDAGNTAKALDANGTPLATDQRGVGFPRVLGAQVDIGAFEAPAPTFTVNSLLDTGTGSGSSGDLRYCITQADQAAGSIINFSVIGTIQLTSTLVLGNDMTITGPGAWWLTVQGGGTSSNSSVFTINSGVTAAISGLTIAGGNSATNGGGISNGGTLTLTNCMLSGDSATNGGGIYNNGTLTLTNCTLSGDSATNGGGIYNNGTLTLTNCTLSGDSATNGGGIANGGTLTLTNSTLTANRAGAGGGLYTLGSSTLVNTIVAGNFQGAAPSTTPNDIAGTVTTGASFNNLIGIGGSGGLTNGTSGNLVDVANPGLGTLGNYGGPTQTIPLLPGSPAIDAGKDSLAPATDQRGVQRGPTEPYAGIHSDIGAFEFTLTSQTITFGPLANQSYGVAPLTLTSTASSGLLVSFAVISGPATIMGNVLTVTGAGKVVVEASQAGNADYPPAIPIDESFTVTPAALTINPTAGQSKVYGAAVPALTETEVGFVNGDSVSLLIGALGTTATTTSGVGNYAFTLSTLSAGANYTLALSASPPTFAVNPVVLTINPTAGQSRVYGAALPALSETEAGFVNGDSASLLTGALGTTATTTSGVGNYAFTLGTLSAGANYTLALSASPPTFAINPAVLTVNPTAGQSKVYGAAVPALTETEAGFVNGDSASLLTGALATSATTTSGVGNYAFTLGTLNAGANYTLAMTVTPPTFAVTPAALTINPTAGQKKIYGAALPGLTETATGFVNGDSASLLIGALGTTATTTSGVGTYAFTLGTLNAGANYTLAVAASLPTFAVTPAVLTINPTAGQSRVYGAALPALTETVAGFVNGDSASLLTGALGTTATTTSRVGNYAFTLGTLSAGANYTLALSASPPTFAVNPAPLVISANSVSAITGQALPTLTATYTGFVNGDSSASLISPPIITTTATVASPAGVYAITIQGASSPNYTITQLPGVLTIQAIPLVPTTVLSASIKSIKLNKHKTAKAIVLVWNSALHTADALNHANFQLSTVPAKKKQHSQVVAIGQIMYQTGSTSLVLLTSKPLNLKTAMKLTINSSGLHDASGNLVGSTTSGQPGPSIVFLITRAGVKIQAITSAWG